MRMRMFYAGTRCCIESFPFGSLTIDCSTKRKAKENWELSTGKNLFNQDNMKNLVTKNLVT
jgi:hypothetical protein